jgi:hypothetical protein
MAEWSAIFFKIRVPFHVFRKSYSPLACSFRSFWSRVRFVVEVIINGGGLPGFLGASCSGNVSSVSVVSVSTSVVLKGAKKLRVNAAFGRQLDSC